MSEPTGKHPSSKPRDIAGPAKAHGDPSDRSAYVTAAVARQIERDNISDLIAVAEAEHDPITAAEIQALRDQLHRAHRGQKQAGAETV
ncbi:CopG family transcriptional regulator [Streptomyces sp. NPDC052052]|uniref:CopG family transcriptional regulator n=1 Tax=Streptomyces sp. NPDC052052 TaxID=3154756 RepID=UPI00341BD163